MDIELAVRNRYDEAAKERVASLCCPVDYDAKYLRVIPQEIIDRDYGCGDPSKHVLPGETVLDLGSGGGKICFIASQVVGPQGRVIGVDMNDEMLGLARGHQAGVASKIGHDNVTFFKAKIQDLAVDRDAVNRYLADHPVIDETTLRDLEAFLAEMRSERPLIANESIDVVVSNCVLNLVDTAEKEQLFDEIFRVLRPGGRAVISDIVSDELVPEHLQQDAELWSGCLSGAMQTGEFLSGFETAGFEDVTLLSLSKTPWQVVENIAFRSATVEAFRPHVLPEDAEIAASESDDVAEQDAVAVTQGSRFVYRGPFKCVVDDAGTIFTRGEICDAASSVAATRPAVRPHFAEFQSDETQLSISSVSRSLPIQASGCCGDADCC